MATQGQVMLRIENLGDLTGILLSADKRRLSKQEEQSACLNYKTLSVRKGPASCSTSFKDAPLDSALEFDTFLLKWALTHRGEAIPASL